MRHWLIFRAHMSTHHQRPIVVTEEHEADEYRAAGHVVLGPFDLTQPKS